MEISFGNKTYNIEQISQYDEIRYSKDFTCICGSSNYLKGSLNIYGFCETKFGFMVIFYCNKCNEYYRHHIGTNSRYSLEKFKKDIGLLLYSNNY